MISGIAPSSQPFCTLLSPVEQRLPLRVGDKTLWARVPTLQRSLRGCHRPFGQQISIHALPLFFQRNEPRAHFDFGVAVRSQNVPLILRAISVDVSSPESAPSRRTASQSQLRTTLRSKDPSANQQCPPSDLANEKDPADQKAQHTQSEYGFSIHDAPTAAGPADPGWDLCTESSVPRVPLRPQARQPPLPMGTGSRVG